MLDRLGARFQGYDGLIQYEKNFEALISDVFQLSSRPAALFSAVAFRIE
jgi:hypothetical protein